MSIYSNYHTATVATSALDQQLLSLAHMVDDFRTSSQKRLSIFYSLELAQSAIMLFRAELSLFRKIKGQTAVLAQLVEADLSDIESGEYKKLRALNGFFYPTALGLTNEVSQLVKSSAALPWQVTISWPIMRFAHICIQPINRLVVSLVKGNQQQLSKVLERIENSSIAPTKYAQQISADQLWADRCQAYDYMV